MEHNNIETPELDKMSLIKDKSQIIGEFLEWLEEEEISLCVMSDNELQTYPYVRIHYTIEELLAKYYKIDLKKVEKEKRYILEKFRKQSRGM